MSSGPTIDSVIPRESPLVDMHLADSVVGDEYFPRMVPYCHHGPKAHKMLAQGIALGKDGPTILESEP